MDKRDNIHANLELAAADRNLGGWNSIFESEEDQPDETVAEPSTFCPIGMQEFPLVINEDISLSMLQARSAFSGVGTDETGSVLWGAAVCLCRWLKPTIVKDRRVLELGCGIGAPSMVAKKYGASHVIATDMEDSTLQLTDHLSKMNKTPIEVRKLDWEFRDGCLDEGFQADVILASDVIYGMSHVRPLAEVIDAFLAEDGVAYIATRESRRGVAEFRHLMVTESPFEEVEYIRCDGFDSLPMPVVFETDDTKVRWTGEHAIHVFKRREEA